MIIINPDFGCKFFSLIFFVQMLLCMLHCRGKEEWISELFSYQSLCTEFTPVVSSQKSSQNFVKVFSVCEGLACQFPVPAWALVYCWYCAIFHPHEQGINPCQLQLKCTTMQFSLYKMLFKSSEPQDCESSHITLDAYFCCQFSFSNH